MIRKLIILISIITISATSLFGQSDVKRINSIKRDPAYLWQEATAATEQEAYDAAEVGLLTIINEYAANNPGSAAAADMVRNNLAQHCSKITMPRGELTRVFLYIAASQLSPAVEIPAAPVTETPAVPVQDIPAAPAEDTTSDAADTASEVKYDKDPIPENIAPVVPEIAKAWQREIVKKLIGASDIVAANAMLARMKAEYKIKRYGPLTECKDLDKSWLILFDDSGKIKALLGPKESERPEYISQTYRSLSDYSGLNAVWFVFAK